METNGGLAVKSDEQAYPPLAVRPAHRGHPRGARSTDEQCGKDGGRPRRATVWDCPTSIVVGVKDAPGDQGTDRGIGIGGRLAAGAIVGLLGLGAASAFSLAKDASTTAEIVAPTLSVGNTIADPPAETSVAIATTTPPTAPPVVAATPLCPLPDASPTNEKAFASPPPDCLDPKATYRAVLVTTEGEFTIELDQKLAPKTANNFVFLARKGFYNGLSFHRVIPGFIVQGGDPKANGTGGPGYTIDDELSDKSSFKIGTVAMANSGPNQNGSQFFIVTGKNGENIPNTSTIFGRVVKGTKTLDAINALGVAPTPDGQELAPQKRITITTVTVSAKGEDLKRVPGLAAQVATTDAPSA